MTKLELLALGVLTAGSAFAANAENTFSLGAGVGVVEMPYKQYDRDVLPVPVITYEGDDFWFRGLGGGYYLWNDDADKLSITAYYSPFRFKPKDSNNNQLRQLDLRKATMMAGLSYIHNTPYGFLRTTLAGDVLDNSNGMTWDAAWLYAYHNGGLTVTPGIGVEWNSDNQNAYYYGVSDSEARRSGLNSYDPGSSWNPYLELSVSYRLTDSWSIYGSSRYTHLSNEIKDSPMVDKSWTGLLFTGVTYRF
ncbi:outer membrane protein [Kosakonia arachidis]|uniref:Outer membrane protein n=1 Tax=Kosakonia arachidis TaxID=551989 RepID=A0A1I6ZAQ9_9ENTR|nr:MipA/OmpV family protein [Kosakonia arachidis]SFT59521.1 outer membrane protein [Kosakonia arachidis]